MDLQNKLYGCYERTTSLFFLKAYYNGFLDQERGIYNKWRIISLTYFIKADKKLMLIKES
jgi:hypothetical protein